MKKSFRPILFGGALLFALSMSFTSCEGALDDVFGEWDKPAPSTVTPSDEGTSPVSVTGITLNKTYTALLIGGTETLTVDAVAPADATDKTVTWSSDNTAAATVDASTGAISGVAAGTATITATAKDGSGVKATCTVYVGLLSGKFTINASGDQIQFAQGNLQATTADLGNTWTWGFAANQWDYIGSATANNKIDGNGTVSADGTVDLFGWVGASNTTWEGDLGTKLNAAMYGISNIGNNGLSDFVTSTNDYGNGDGENIKSDWGNTIGTGWRTLNKDEWAYLLNTRASGSTVGTTSDVRFTKAIINTDNGSGGVKGLILFPDGITIAAEEANTWPNPIDNSSNWNAQFTIAKWEALAAKGCVFLPAAGYRLETSIWNVFTYGSYWSSTSSGTTRAYYICFRSDGFDFSAGQGNRCNGVSVRLVVKVPKP